MTAFASVMESHNLPLPGERGGQIRIRVDIQLNLVIDQARLRGDLTLSLADYEQRAHGCWGFFSYRDQRSQRWCEIATHVSARWGTEGSVTAHDTFVTQGNGREGESYYNPEIDRASNCRRRQLPGMRCTTDVIWLRDVGRVAGESTLVHEIGHALGISHTASTASIMYAPPGTFAPRVGVARGSGVTEADAMGIINQLRSGEQIVPGRYTLSSVAVGGRTGRTPLVSRWPRRAAIQPPQDV